MKKQARLTLVRETLKRLAVTAGVTPPQTRLCISRAVECPTLLAEQCG
jgi:hypothetical protein